MPQRQPTTPTPNYPQAGDGGHGLNWPFSFTKWTNTDLLNGIAYSGFAIATVDHEKMVVDFYTVQNGETVPLRVTTYKGSYPMVQFAPEGVKAVKLPNLVRAGLRSSACAGGGTAGLQEQAQDLLAAASATSACT